MARILSVKNCIRLALRKTDVTLTCFATFSIVLSHWTLLPSVHHSISHFRGIPFLVLSPLCDSLLLSNSGLIHRASSHGCFVEQLHTHPPATLSSAIATSQPSLPAL